ncbi:MAG: glycosyl transferase family 2 [Rhodocyclales bacterium]|nr:glycosyl transferase family 2 [Rhodocyclales bacterium]
MTYRKVALKKLAWLRLAQAGTLSTLLCVYANCIYAADPIIMNLAPALTQDSPVQAPSVEQSVALADAHEGDSVSVPLRLEHMLSTLGQLVEPDMNGAGAIAQSPSWTSILKFLYWFALLLLVSLTKRDALRLFHHLLSRPPAARPSMPYAPWPSITVIFESHTAHNIATNLAALAAADYPSERLKVLVLCPLQEPKIVAAIQTAATTMPDRVIAMQSSDDGDVAGRCFSAGIRFGNGELVMVLSDTQPCPVGAIKACAGRFFDPSLGALLGFLPGASASDRAIAPRMANLLRLASHTAGIAATAGMTPGTGLLALRRSAVRTTGIDTNRATDCFALLRQLECFGSRHTVQEGIVAAGDAVHNWETRSHWIELCAGAFAATMPLNPLHWLSRRRALPLNFGMRGKLMLPALWSIVALGSMTLYVSGNAFAAAIGLAVCTATAYGVGGMPSAFNCTAILFRAHGRRAETSLIAWAPVMFCHDLVVTVRSVSRTLCRRAYARCIGRQIPTPAPTQPLEQSTLA